MSGHDPLPNTVPGSEGRGPDSLSMEDIKLVKNFLRAFESIVAGARPDEGVPQSLEVAFKDYKLVSDDLKREISELLLQLQRVGGHDTHPIVKHLKVIIDNVSFLDGALYISSQHPECLTDEVMAPLRDLELACADLLRLLYRQNHAFRFLQRLVGILNDLQGYIVGQSNMKAEFSMMSSNVIQRLKSAFAFLRDDFRSFSDKTLPRFVVEEEERATTRYLTLTTIATFFSSITATTLQFSFAGETKPLSGVVNLFWYMSLVFSVSAGINSLLSMLWRKSAVYSEARRPPKCFKLWLTDAPIYFLAISAFAFIIGLSLFVYSSDQPTYVASTTIGFTTLHILAILIVISWFIFRQNWSTFFVQYHRRNILWIFLFEDEVIEANRFIGGIRNWPESLSSPNYLIMILRHLMILLRACSKGVGKYLLAPIQDIFKRMKSTGSKPARIQEGDQEAGVRGGKDEVGDHKAQVVDRNAGIGDGKAEVGDREAGEGEGEAGVGYAEAHSEKQDPSRLEVRRVVEEFKSALRNTFGGKNPIAVADFEKRFRDWQRPSYHLEATTIEITMRSILWGYPKLLRQFQTDVYPAMLRREAKYREDLELKSRSQGSGMADNPSVNQLPSGSTTVEAGGQGGDKALMQSPSRFEQSELTHKASPRDAGPSARSLVAGYATGESSLRNIAGEKGSDKEQKEEGPEQNNQSVTKSREGLQSK